MLDDALEQYASAFDALGGETITWTAPDGTTRSIVALVDRRPPTRADGSGIIMQPQAEIDVRNDSTYGVSATETLQRGSFTIAERRGGATTKTFLVTDPAVQLVAQDAGRLRFSF